MTFITMKDQVQNLYLWTIYNQNYHENST